MQSPASVNPMSVEAIVNALRQPQGVQLAGDVIPFVPPEGYKSGDFQRTGPATTNALDMVRKLRAPGVDLSGVRLMPDAVWSGFQYRHATPPPVQLPPLGGPNMPRGGGGGFLPPKL